MNDTTETRDPAEIEREIRQTQDEMSRTVDKIGNQLTARNVINALLDKADANNVDARMVIDGARRNPLALAMIAGGAIWLVSDSDAKLPSKMPSLGFGKSSNGASDWSEPDAHHRDYVSHMERIEWQPDEDPVAYQRRRDLARANYLMLERRHDEDDHSFRQRLDDATEKFRERRHAWMDRGSRATTKVTESGRAAVSRASTAVSDTGRAAASRAQQTFTDNPLVGGLAAAAVGAIFGTLLPITRTEQEKLAGVGEKARELASEQKDNLTEMAREKKDQLLSSVEEQAKPASQSGQQQQDSQLGGGGQHSFANDQQDLQLAASQPPTTQAGGSDDSSMPRPSFGQDGGRTGPT
jgi:ElaB/YqjD/DUF883 family membrane-anchored ribosome-binding protein